MLNVLTGVVIGQCLPRLDAGLWLRGFSGWVRRSSVLVPYGGVLVAEDGQEIQHLFGSPSGDETFPVARNDFNDKEFTGPVYSPDHQIRFAKLQIPGTMFAIIGPWRDQG